MTERRQIFELGTGWWERDRGEGAPWNTFSWVACYYRGERERKMTLSSSSSLRSIISVSLWRAFLRHLVADSLLLISHSRSICDVSRPWKRNRCWSGGLSPSYRGGKNALNIFPKESFDIDIIYSKKMTKKRKKKDGKLISCVFLVAPWWGVAGKKDQRGRKDSHLVGEERERGISHDTLAARSSSRCLWCFPMGGLAFFVAPKEEEEEECLQNGRLHTNSQTHILPTGSFLKSHIIWSEKRHSISPQQQPSSSIMWCPFVCVPPLFSKIHHRRIPIILIESKKKILFSRSHKSNWISLTWKASSSKKNILYILYDILGPVFFNGTFWIEEILERIADWKWRRPIFLYIASITFKVFKNRLLMKQNIFFFRKKGRKFIYSPLYTYYTPRWSS